MRRVVGFVRHHRHATAVESASAVELIHTYAERTGATVDRVYEVPSNSTSEVARRLFQQALTFVQEPANTVTMLVLPRSRDLPRGFQAIADVARARSVSQFDVTVLDLDVCTSGQTALDICVKLESTMALCAQLRSERIKRGTRRAKDLRGSRA